jgi:deoxycytidylate deaminase
VVAAQVFMTSYYADSASYVQALNHSERQQVGGTGPCAIIDPTGRVVAEELARLKRIVVGYDDAIESACATADRCIYDGDAFTRVRLQRQDIGGDLQHIPTAGHAEAAETAWRAMINAGVIPADG